VRWACWIWRRWCLRLPRCKCGPAVCICPHSVGKEWYQCKTNVLKYSTVNYCYFHGGNQIQCTGM
jgi:hypothetical protein